MLVHVTTVGILRLMLKILPAAREIHELTLIFARMSRSESCDITNLIILHLDRRIGLAHERIPKEINAVSYMWWRGHHGNFLFHKFPTVARSLESSLTAFAYAVLCAMIEKPAEIKRGHGTMHARQCS